LLAVAKRIPVRLRFQLDQRKLNVLLSACGNARLPVEVRQIRVNPDHVTTGPSGGGDSGPLMPGVPAFGGEGGGPGAMPGVGMRPGMVKGNLVTDATVDPSLIDIELYGIVYIYNPVNKSQLGEAPAGTPPTAGIPAGPVNAGG
jgi:hypothetical protein